MVKRVGLFSDLHGDKNNLNLIANMLKGMGISNTVFLGDFIYKNMADLTSSENTLSTSIRQQLLQESPLREDFMNGLFSDEQLERYANMFKNAKDVGKRISEQEYLDYKEALSGLEVTVLGGNWDYGKEIKKVFQDNYLNGQNKEIDGINFLGISGGGPQSPMTATTETLADNGPEEKYQVEEWLKNSSPNSFEADVLISHVPLTGGDGLTGTGGNSAHHLKNQFLKNKAEGQKMPKVNIHGHDHGASVKYDEETDTFLVCTGSSSRNHNHTPTFMVGDFDDNNKLIGVEQYTIYSSLEGYSEVCLTGIHKLDWENKKVDFEAKNKTIHKERNLEKLKDNLSLDDNIRLTHAGLNIKYESLNAQEKDRHLRVNITIMQDELSRTSNEMRTVLQDCAKKHLIDDEGNLLENNLETAIEEVQKELTQKARDVLGVRKINPEDEDNFIFRSVLMNSVYGVMDEELTTALKNKKIKSATELRNWGADAISSGSEKLSNLYQNHIFKDLKSQDYQEMVELYMPAAYERIKELDHNTAFQLWVKTYTKGEILTSHIVEQTDAYKKKKDFVAKKRTKKDLADLFDFDATSKFAKPEQATTENVPKELADMLKEGIKSKKLPVLEDEKGDYVIPSPQMGPVYLDDKFKEGLDYTPKTQEKIIGERIKRGEIPVIEKEGKRYLMTESGQRFLLDDHEKFGLSPEDYKTKTEEEYQNFIRQNLIKQQMLNQNPMIEQPQLNGLDKPKPVDTPIGLPQDPYQKK